MKKIILISFIIIFSLSFKKVNGALLLSIPCRALVSSSESEKCLESQEKSKIYLERKTTLEPYSQFFNEVGVNLTSDTSDDQYYQWLSKLKLYKEEYEEKQNEYDKRYEVLQPYSKFFSQIGVNLTLDTDNSQYKEWLEGLIIAQDNYNKEQENIASEKKQKEQEYQDKIKELEKRVETLELKQTNSLKNEKSNEALNNQQVAKDSKSETVTQEDNKVTEINQDLVPVDNYVVSKPQEKVGIFKRIFNWFKGFKINI